jgi:hypothetical protein
MGHRCHDAKEAATKRLVVSNPGLKMKTRETRFVERSRPPSDWRTSWTSREGSLICEEDLHIKDVAAALSTATWRRRGSFGKSGVQVLDASDT